MSPSMRALLRTLVPFPLRRRLASIRGMRGLTDLFGRWAVGGWHATVARGVTARRWRQVKVGPATIVDPGTHFHTNDDGPGVRIQVGTRGFIGRHCFFSAGESIDIAADCNVGANCNLLAAGHVYDDPTIPYAIAPVVSYGPMRLGPNTWVGVGSTLVGGLDIGFGTVIAAGSLVRTSLPPLCLAAGRPAVPLKLFDWPTRAWVRLPDDADGRGAALAHHVATIPSEAEYVRQLTP